MLFVFFVLIVGFVHAELSDNAVLPEVPDIALSPEFDPVMLEISAMNNTNVSAIPDDDNSLADLKSLVTSMTKGDATLTAFIVKKLLELKRKTYAEHKIINARVARKLKAKKKEMAAKIVQDKLTSTAIAAYAAEVINSKYELLQVNREIASLDRICKKLNSMVDWKTCPKYWKKFGRSCYRTLKRAYAWQAEAKCLAVGGSLVRVDNADDKKAIYWMGRNKDGYLILGFFRSLRTGNWMYLDGTEVNVPSWYRWYSSYHNNKQYNYVRYYSGYQKVLGCHYNWQGGPLCEHRLAVNLLK